MKIFSRKFLIDTVCGFIPNKDLRARARVSMRYPDSRKYIRFARQDAGMPVRKMHLAFGVGHKNMVVIINDAIVYKFSLTDDGASAAAREERILAALVPAGGVAAPKMEIIKWHGVTVRRYEFCAGQLLYDFSPTDVAKHRDKIARQLARFIFNVATADPTEIRDLKPTPNARPGHMRGWCHNDLAYNFMLDDDFNITWFIDWQNAAFCDLNVALDTADIQWSQRGFDGLAAAVRNEYERLWAAQ